MSRPMPDLVFKIVTQADWRAAEAAGRFDGSPDDRRDGFVHLSARDQVAATAAKHFAGAADLLLAACDPARLGDALRWETSRGGALFPHLYGPLPVDAVEWIEPLPLGPDGIHIVPARLA